MKIFSKIFLVLSVVLFGLINVSPVHAYSIYPTAGNANNGGTYIASTSDLFAPYEGFWNSLKSIQSSDIQTPQVAPTVQSLEDEGQIVVMNIYIWLQGAVNWIISFIAGIKI